MVEYNPPLPIPGYVILNDQYYEYNSYTQAHKGLTDLQGGAQLPAAGPGSS